MKIRYTFVSNSSSSNFVVRQETSIEIIQENIKKFLEDIQPFIRSDGSLSIDDTWPGTKEFGWERIQYTNLFDKLNWAILQANYGDCENHTHQYSQTLLQLLTDLIKCPIINVDFGETLLRTWGFIDHQSAAGERPNVLDIFADQQTLIQFIFGNDYIQGGNDNDWDSNWDDEDDD